MRDNESNWKIMLLCRDQQFGQMNILKIDFPYKMTINLEMFGALMENIIMCDIDNNVVITMNGNRRRMSNTHVFK